MSATNPPVLCVGEALIDFIVTDGAGSLESANAFDARDGGAPANVAVALARLGVPSAFVGAVGDDPFGARLIAGLRHAGVRTEFISRKPLPTTLAFTWKDARGDGHFRLMRSADIQLTPPDVEPALPGALALVVGSVALAAEPSRTAITAGADRAAVLGVPVCFDVNLRPTLWSSLDDARAACAAIQRYAKVLKLSLDDARGLLDGRDTPGDVFAALDAIHPVPIVVLTDGSRGAWFRDHLGDVCFQCAYPVAAVEPTGAGDAFFGALLSRLLVSGWATPTAGDIQYAAAAGALATLRPGAWDGQPTAAELATFVATTPAPS